jgi:hypothetical protein
MSGKQSVSRFRERLSKHMTPMKSTHKCAHSSSHAVPSNLRGKNESRLQVNIEKIQKSHLLGDLIVTVLAPVNILVVHLVAADDELPDTQSVGEERVLACLCGSRTIRAGPRF